jgi:Carboxypeptidase regulatory-like domain
MQKPLNARPVLFALSLLTLFAAAAAAQQSNVDKSQAKPEELGVITGRVLNESGQPIPGARVSLGAFGGTGGRSTATDSDGNFKAPGLDAGLYRVGASSPGYVSEAPQSGANSSPAYYRPGDSVTLKLIKGGVIAGTVTNSAGEPVVNIGVRAIRVRDAEGKQQQMSGASRERTTDDRGYFRLYGLQPGSYVVYTGGIGQSFGPSTNPYANDAPTYAPASTRDTAAEIVVHSGEEALADIRYRGEPGHSVSGKITGVQTSLPATPGVSLVDLESHSVIASTGATGEDRTFQLNGVSDGEYEVVATGSAGPNGDRSVSAPRRLTVKGSDVTGLELALAPLGSIAGRIVVETDSKLACGRRRDSLLRETLVSLGRVRVEEKPDPRNPRDKSAQAIDPQVFGPASSDLVPNDKSEFTFRGLYAGSYRLNTGLRTAGWFVRAIALGAPDQKSAAGRAPEANPMRDGIAIKSGEKLTGLTINITEGGAGLRGRVSVPEGQQLSRATRVYVTPSDREDAENMLRFYEAPVDNDGSFTIGNVAPGRYWIIARSASESDAGARSIRQDSTLRGQIVKEAQALKKEISFKPCERVTDYDLPYVSSDKSKQ